MTNEDVVRTFQVALKNPDELRHYVKENIVYVKATADGIDESLLWFVDRPFCKLRDNQWGVQGRVDDVFYDLLWQQRQKVAAK